MTSELHGVSGRPLLTLLPALAAFSYFLGNVPLFWWLTRKHGVVPDLRIEGRRPSILIPRWLIYYLLWSIAPLERALIWLRVSPNRLTTIGGVLSIAAAVALAHGWFDLGGWLYLFVGILDILDGRVARATGRMSKAGAFYDSVLDRYAEFAVFVGLIVYYRASAILPIVLAALMGSLMVSYVRARAELLGAGDVAARGAMQRPERIFLLGVALAASPFVSARVTVAALAFLAVSSNATALIRTRAVLRALSSNA